MCVLISVCSADFKKWGFQNAPKPKHTITVQKLIILADFAAPPPPPRIMKIKFLY